MDTSGAKAPLHPGYRAIGNARGEAPLGYQELEPLEGHIESDTEVDDEESA